MIGSTLNVTIVTIETYRTSVLEDITNQVLDIQVDIQATATGSDAEKKHLSVKYRALPSEHHVSVTG